MPHFNRYIDVDYSVAETADSSCRGLRVAAFIIAAVRLAREPNLSVQTPHAVSVIGESITVARNIEWRVRQK